MQIQFDPRDRDACASVLAMVGALHPELDTSVTISGSVETIELTADDAELIDPTDDSEPDAATAFGAGNSAASGTGAESARAGTPENGTPEASNNGPTAAPIASPSSDVELDADGLPWDGRIHSGPEDKRPKNADGRWRRKRGVDDAEVERVTAELRQVMGAPAPTPTPAAAPTPPPPPAAASPEPAPAAAPTPAPAAPPPTPPAADTASGPAGATTADSAPPAPPTPPAASAPAANFAELMKKVTARQTAGTLTVADTKAAAEALGLTGVADLLKRPDLIAAFEAALPGEA